MEDSHTHTTHPALVKRLKRAGGHLQHVIAMIESERPCTEIAAQLHAVEAAVTAAKRTLIHDHIDHCLGPDDEGSLAELRQLAKLL